MSLTILLSSTNPVPRTFSTDRPIGRVAVAVCVAALVGVLDGVDVGIGLGVSVGVDVAVDVDVAVKVRVGATGVTGVTDCAAVGEAVGTTATEVTVGASPQVASSRVLKISRISQVHKTRRFIESS